MPLFPDVEIMACYTLQGIKKYNRNDMPQGLDQ